MKDEKIYTIPGLNITLLRRKGSPYIHYYFRYNQKTFRGSTKTSDLKTSEKFSLNKYNEIEQNKGKTYKFEKEVKDFLVHKEGKLSQKTFSEYERQSKLLIEFFKGREVSTIVDEDYDKYKVWRKRYYTTHKKKRIQTYRKNGKIIKGCEFKNVGNTTINREIGLLVSILRLSHKRKHYRNQFVPSWKKLKEKRREEILTKKEYLKLEEYWEKHNPYYGEIIRFVQNTGIRYPSELNQIKWKNVFLDKKFMVIVRKGKPPKPMSIPLVGTPLEILNRLKDRDNIQTGSDDYVFVNDNGVRIKDIRKSWRKGIKKCGIKKDISMYSLRHLFTTRMITTRPDVPLKVLSEILGHTDSKMIDKHYSHLRIKETVRIMERSEGKRQEILKEKKKKREDTQLSIFSILTK